MTFLILILIITNSLPASSDIIDLCSITDLLIVDFFYICNKTVINEVKKLFGIEIKEREIPEDGFLRENDDRDYTLNHI